MNPDSTFKDHFSGKATDYTRYRPSYPPALFAWLAGQTGRHNLAWDCGCVSGQASIGVAALLLKLPAADA